MKLVSTAMGAVVPGSIVLGPDGHPWEVFPGGWLAPTDGSDEWHLVKDPNTRVLWCVYEESDAIAAVAAHFTIESMEIANDGN